MFRSELVPSTDFCASFEQCSEIMSVKYIHTREARRQTDKQLKEILKMNKKAEKEWKRMNISIGLVIGATQRISQLAVNSYTRIVYSTFWYVFSLPCLPSTLPPHVSAFFLQMQDWTCTMMFCIMPWCWQQLWGMEICTPATISNSFSPSSLPFVAKYSTGRNY